MSEPLHVLVAPELYEKMKGHWSEPVQVLMREPVEDDRIEMMFRTLNDRPTGMVDEPELTVRYTNHQGDTRMRTVTPRRLWWGSTEYHPEPQWLLDVWDHDKVAARTYALANCDFLGGGE